LPIKYCVQVQADLGRIASCKINIVINFKEQEQEQEPGLLTDLLLALRAFLVLRAFRALQLLFQIN
jgi:hypothetical protein